MEIKPHKIKQVKKTNLINDLRGYELFTGRETCLSRDEMWISWVVDWGVAHFLFVPNRDGYDYYVETKSFYDFIDRHSKHILSDVKNHIANYPIVKEKILVTAKELSELCKTGNKQKIINKYLEHAQFRYNLGDYIYGAWDVIYKIEKEILDEVGNNIEIIISLEQPIEYLKMERDLFLFEPKDLVTKYGWLNIYNPYDKLFSENDFIKLKAEKNQKDIQKQFDNFDLVYKKFKDYIEKIENKDLKDKISLVHAYAYLKTDRIDVWRQAIYFMSGFYEYLKELSGLSLKEVSYMSMVEIVDFLQGKDINKDTVKKRSKGQTLLHFYQGGVDELIDINEIRLIRKKLEEQKESNEELKGIVASKGQAKGIVKIITHSSEIDKVKNGNILVAKYTFPSFTPAMKRAAAIVTDEGGLTSHAAIVSRELKKPCIVGIKSATKVFKDNDIMEVDAEQGIVRKI